MKLIAINPENLKLAWKDTERYIVTALEYADGKYKLEDIRQMVLRGTLILWVIYNEEKKKAAGCLLTEIYIYPHKKNLCIFLMGADDFKDAVPLIEELKEYASGIGCDSIEFYGRPGWETLLKPYGFEKIHTVMRLKI